MNDLQNHNTTGVRAPISHVSTKKLLCRIEYPVLGIHRRCICKVVGLFSRVSYQVSISCKIAGRFFTSRTACFLSLLEVSDNLEDLLNITLALIFGRIYNKGIGNLCLNHRRVLLEC